MKKLTNLLKESNFKPEMGKVYSNLYAKSFIKENDEESDKEQGLSDEQKAAFYEAVKQYKKFGESVYRNAGLGEVYEAIKNMVETASKVTISETGDWFDNVTVSRHMKRMGESFNIFEKTLKEVSTLQQRLEASYDEIGEVLGKYYEINEMEDEIEEGNEFGAARAKAIANGDDSFEVDGKKYPVKDVDKDDKENAKEFSNESINEGASTEEKRIVMLAVRKIAKYRNVPINQSVVDVQRAAEELERDITKGKLKESMKLTDMIKKPSTNEALSIDPRKVYGGTAAKENMVLVAQKGLAQILDLSKKNPSNVFKISDDNYTNFGPYYVKNGKIAKYTVANPNYDFEKNKVRSLKVPSDVILKFVIVEGSTSVNEAKYDIGMARKGNGITIYNRAEEEAGDYKNVAHISDNGVVKYYDKKLPSNIKKQIEAEASKMKESVNEGKKRFNIKYGVGKSKYVVNYHDGVKKHKDGSDFFDVEILKNQKDLEAFKKALLQKGFVAESVNESKSMKLTDMLNESFGMGELPSSKLMKMKVSAKDMLDSVNPKKVNESSEEDVVEEGRASTTKLLKSVVNGETSRVEGIKLSKEMAQSFIDWIRLSPYGKKYGDLPFYMLFKAAFNWGLNRHADKKSKEYKELEAKAKEMAKKK